MELSLYQVDAFASRVFEGNPAAVVPLASWLEDQLMQRIAMENNLAETAFFVPSQDRHPIRWFTPATEVDLCGHATLASAWVLWNELGHRGARIEFESKSGTLGVDRDGEWLALDFPARPPEPAAPCAGLLEALGGEPLEVLASQRDYMVVYGSEDEVRRLRPSMAGLMEMDRSAVIVTAQAQAPDVDFVSRFFAPALGVPEDPVTGSAHSTLIPYWARRLGKERLAALQVSPRGGSLRCQARGSRVSIAGQAALYLRGSIHV